MQVTSHQVRAARALLRLEPTELARRADLPVATVTRIETNESGQNIDASALSRVRAVLENAGVEFITDGVRMRRPPINVDRDKLYADLISISDEIADLIEGTDPLTDKDLYDEDGLPA